MANPSKRKGSEFERAVCEALSAALALPVERRAPAGRLDRGDVAGLPGWVLECKNTRALDLAGAVDEAAAEAGNAGVENYAAVVKRRGRGVGEAYVVMPLHRFLALLSESICPASVSA